MDQKKYFMYGGVAIVIFAIGIAIGSLAINRGAVTSSTGSTNTFQAGWDAAKKRLSDTGYAFPTMSEIMSVSGTVKDARSDGMTITIRPLEPLADPVLDTRNVKFDANTKFYVMEQKDPIKYQKELEAFNLKMKTSLKTPPAAPINYPQLFTRITGTAQDIKTGMIVTITAAGNIKDKSEFVATEVAMQTVASPTAAPVVPVAPAVILH